MHAYLSSALDVLHMACNDAGDSAFADRWNALHRGLLCIGVGIGTLGAPCISRCFMVNISSDVTTSTSHVHSPTH